MSQLAGMHRALVRAAMNAPFLSKEEEFSLARRWRDQHDAGALHRLATAHMRLVIALASRFRHYGLSLSDLVQEGHIGLLEAAARFEPERDVRFSTYATWWIRASMQDFILRNWSIVRGGTSSAQKALFFNLRHLRARLTQRASLKEGVDIFGEIAAAVGVSRADVEVMDARLSGSDMSLNAPVADAETSGADRVEFLVDAAPLPDEAVGESIDGERRVGWLRAALGVLSERELNILRARRLQDHGTTLEALGARLGISKERVRQIENRAIEKLRAALLKRHPNIQTALG
jgi:RNA polymerase sigma-32 factor